jgi:pimeloyl-ACP methyl ester carboxylesterase
MIHIYSGLGGTAALYGRAWRKAVPGHYHDWPEWKGETTLAQLATRVINRDSIKPGDILIGSSLGGMLACEVAKQVHVKQVILIGSAIHVDELSPTLRKLYPLITRIPIEFIQWSARIIPWKLAQMFANSEAAFMRAMTKAIFQWQGAEKDTPIKRIHGTRDRPIPNPRWVDAKIRGGHLLAIYQESECITTIQAWLKQTSK